MTLIIHPSHTRTKAVVLRTEEGYAVNTFNKRSQAVDYCYARGLNVLDLKTKRILDERLGK